MALAAIGLVLVHALAAQPEPPAPTSSPPPDAPSKGAAAPSRDDALAAPVIAALQLGAACGTYAVGVPVLSVASYGCAFLVCGLCLTPAAAGYLGTWVGDRFGASRAPAIWPIVAAYGGLILSAVGVGAIYFAAFTNSSPWIAMGGGVGILAGLAASVIGVPVAYALSAEEKEPGDDGSAWPGILEPARPRAPVNKKAPDQRTRPDPPPPPQLPLLPTPPLLEPQGLVRAMGF